MLFHVLLVLNVLWFGTGFIYFALMPRRAAKLVTTREQREGRLYDILVGSVTFLGGMNLAFCVLALVLLVASSEFPSPSQRAVLRRASSGIPVQQGTAHEATSGEDLLAGRDALSAWSRGPRR